MAALPDDGEISFLDLYQNINSTSGTPGSSIDLKDLSETLADGSIVVPQTTTKRNSIRTAQYAIDEVYGADYPSGILSNMTIKRDGSTETEFVDGETLQVGYDISPWWDPNYGSGDFVDNLIQIIDSSDNVDLSGTNRVTDANSSGTKSKSFSSLALDAGVYDVKIICDETKDPFNQINNSSAFTYYDQIASPDTGLGYSSANVSTAGESVSTVTVTPTVSTGTQTGYALGSITSVI